MIKDQISFLKKMSSLLEIDMPIREAMPLSYSLIKHTKFKDSLRRSEERLKNGETLATAFAFETMFWDQLTLSLIWSGELSGKLSHYMQDAALLLEKRQRFLKTIYSSMLYPMIISFISLALVLFLLFYIYPKILPVLLSLRVPLPLSTKIVLYAKNSIEKTWMYISLFVVMLIAVQYIPIIKMNMRKALSSAARRLPVIGSLLRAYDFSIISKNIGTMMNTEIGLIKALQLSASQIDDASLREAISGLQLAIQQGQSMAVYVQKNTLFPRIWHEYLFIGERTSRLAQMMLKISEVHETELEDHIVTYSKLIEPVLMVITGLFVLFIALSIISPMYSISQYVQ